MKRFLLIALFIIVLIGLPFTSSKAESSTIVEVEVINDTSFNIGITHDFTNVLFSSGEWSIFLEKEFQNVVFSNNLGVLPLNNTKEDNVSNGFYNFDPQFGRGGVKSILYINASGSNLRRLDD